MSPSSTTNAGISGPPGTAGARPASSASPVAAPPDLDLTIVIPCLNEAGTLPLVVEKGLRTIARLGLRGACP